MSVEDAINYKPSEEEDYYALLSCDECSTVEQITAEYKVLALQYHPDKNKGDKEAERKFQQLKHAKEVLCDPAMRSIYDKWRRSGIAISFKQWAEMKDHVHQDASGAGVSAGQAKVHAANAHRRASEGGANIYYGASRHVGWESEAPSEVISKFRNYEI
ncbi:dnaJ domain-containing protein isoform X2 [Calliopsis andreniformis]|uniref:dnaJ domain-containing protein isoform X2 n=1 Tax=Calliopsis andreniformis TaxID=337506 RepID=UPI003FCE8650